MPRHLTVLAALTAAIMTLSAPALRAQETTTVTHAQGETVIEGVPSKVLVQDWAAFDNLHALGVTVAGVPSSATPAYLREFIPADALQLGSLQEPDFEGIAAAGADLYIVASRSRNAYGTASGILPTIDLSVDNAELIEGIKANLTTLGEIFDRTEQADELKANLDAKLAEVRQAAEGAGDALVLVTNAGNVGVYGPASRVSWIHNELGIPSAMDRVQDGDHGGNAVSFEFILEADPDWLFVVDRDAGVAGGEGNAAAALLDNELVNQTTAAREGQIVYLDPAAAYITMHGYHGVMLLLDQVLAGFQG
ncbi:siderophore ABC transporter substrate-binding protein [Aureimonas populi]|uniref:Siderophore ABC transporter substrate-binding protein n=1 Tax=Aureimonas populi TaxID=1701758 RepID=A0ABW5CHV9_9HYPH|nr:ABC transporter substrate-binding protein [Aureimonas populi]